MRPPSARSRSVSKCSIRLPGFQAATMMWSSSAIRSGRDDQRDVAADRLLGGVAEQPLGGGVPALNDAVERLADDGVVRRLDDRREQPGGEQLVDLVPLDAPLRGDVAEDQDAAGDAGRARPDRRGAVVDRTLGAVPADEHGVVRQADDDALAQRPRRRVLDRLARLLVDDPEHRVERLAERLVLRPAGQRLGHCVQVGDAAVDVGGDDRIADAAQRDPQHLARSAARALRARASPRRTR